MKYMEYPIYTCLLVIASHFSDGVIDSLLLMAGAIVALIATYTDYKKTKNDLHQ